jgi:hypothetical protein
MKLNLGDFYAVILSDCDFYKKNPVHFKLPLLKGIFEILPILSTNLKKKSIRRRSCPESVANVLEVS